MMESLAGAMPNLNWESNDLPGAWKTFETHCSFMFQGPLKEKSEEEQCAYLMIWLGEKGRDVYTTLGLTADEKKSTESLLKKFGEYVKPKSNKVFNRYKFHCKKQGESETCEQFITELKVLAKDCGYTAEVQDEMVRDKIVFGTKHKKVRENLIKEGEALTLKRAIEIARTFEIEQSQLKTMNTGEDPNVHLINKKAPQQIKTPHKFVHRQKPHDKSKGAIPKTSPSPNICKRCGNLHKFQKCPALGKTCRKCNRLNHFAAMCKTNMKKDKQVHELHEESDSDLDFDNLYVGSLGSTSSETNSDSFIETMKIGDKQINFQLDTGARCNVITKSDFSKLNIKGPLRKASAKLKSFSGHRIPSEGLINLPVTVKDKIMNIDFYVVETDSISVIGAESCENLGLIKRIHGIESNYHDLFEGLGCMPGTHTIKIDSSITPKVHPPRKVPISLKYRVKEELSRMEKLGVIKRQKEPTPWVNSMVTVVKPNGQIRICIDPRDLNNAILREHYPMKTIEEVVAEMPNAKVFSKLDATSGFWQLSLDEESSKLTTFNTPFGRYRFLRAPFGIKSIPEMYQRRMSEIVEDIEGVAVIVDDILVWGSTVEEHDKRLKLALDKLRQNNVKLSESKCEFRKDQIDYVGHNLSSEGLKPAEEKIRAVRDMKKPENKKELQTFLGFITYLQKFLPNMSEISAPLRLLLEKDIEWHWEELQETSFQRLKQLAIEAPVLGFYDPKEELVLNVDASSYALGAVITQKGKPIAYASRALNSTQQRYSVIEKETLAVVFGTQKFHSFVYGRNFIVESDHKPLENIFRKPLSECPPRLGRFILQLQKYDFVVKYQPGRNQYLSDTLSRLNLSETSETLVPEVELNEISLNSHLPVSPEKYKQYQEETLKDRQLQTLKTIVEHGWPEQKVDVPEEIKIFWPFRHEISCIDNLMFKGWKLIIPQTLRSEMLKLVHESHLGVVKCKTRAREFMYWPGMMSQIEDTVSKCNTCAIHNSNRNRREPMISSELPNRPSAKVGADLFELKGKHYLLTIDYYSKWPEVEKLDNLTSGNVICYLKKQFSRFGYIDELVTDNGPQFSSEEFKNFAKEYEFTHTTSSPHYSQSNGQTERYVQTVKNMIKKNKNPYQAMLDYRNSPLENIGLSPAQLHLGRRLKSNLPASAAALKPAVDTSLVQKGHVNRQNKQQYYYNKQFAGKSLKNLNPGDTVMIDKYGQKFVPGTVVKKHSTPRSYIVETLGGKKLRRTRRHLKQTRAKFPVGEPDVTPGSYWNQPVISNRTSISNRMVIRS